MVMVSLVDGGVVADGNGASDGGGCGVSKGSIVVHVLHNAQCTTNHNNCILVQYICTIMHNWCNL